MKMRMLAVTVMSLLLAPLAMADHHVNGKWEAEVQGRTGAQQVTFNFTEESGKLTGTVTTTRGDSEIQDGKVDGDKISFKQHRSFGQREVTLIYSGTVKGDEIQFTREIEGFDRTSEFTAKRAK